MQSGIGTSMHSHDHHAHDHHSQGHPHHHHGPPGLDDESNHALSFEPGRERRLMWAFALTLGTLLAEAIGGWLSGSLALLVDAGHMLVDAAALLFAWLGAHFAQRPADRRRSYGYARLEVLVGYTNALSQFVLVIWIAIEAVSRLLSPAPILSGMMLVVALIGLGVNMLVLRVLGGHSHDDLNTAAARLHVVGDLLGSIGAVTAAVLVRQLDWLWADAVVSLGISILILFSAWRLLRRSAHILLEGVPEGMDVAQVRECVEAGVAGVHDVHHVHVWQLGGGTRIATLHARVEQPAAVDAAIMAIRDLLHSRFGIDHVTVQVEGGFCDGPQCKPGHACDGP